MVVPQATCALTPETQVTLDLIERHWSSVHQPENTCSLNWRGAYSPYWEEFIRETRRSFEAGRRLPSPGGLWTETPLPPGNAPAPPPAPPAKVSHPSPRGAPNSPSPNRQPALFQAPLSASDAMERCLKDFPSTWARGDPPGISIQNIVRDTLRRSCGSE